MTKVCVLTPLVILWLLHFGWPFQPGHHLTSVCHTRPDQTRPDHSSLPSQVLTTPATAPLGSNSSHRYVGAEVTLLAAQVGGHGSHSSCSFAIMNRFRTKRGHETWQLAPVPPYHSDVTSTKLLKLTAFKASSLDKVND